MATKKPTAKPTVTAKAPPKRKGSLPGERRGGRQKGTPNKRTAMRKEVDRLCKEYGKTPLEFMMGLMNDKDMPTAYRADMAKAAAPYVHAKLASITIKGDASAPLATHNMDKAEFEAVAKKVVKDI